MSVDSLDWLAITVQLADYMFPVKEMGPWDRMVYLHLLRRTRIAGVRSALFSVEGIAAAIPISDVKAREVLRRLDMIGVVAIVDRTRLGHRVEVYLPEEIEGIVPMQAEDVPELDLTTIDFFRQREYAPWLVRREGGRCFYCLRVLAAESTELDHLVPQAQQGDNSFRNIVASCHTCNKAKGEFVADDFLRSLLRAGRLSDDEFSERLRSLDLLRSGLLLPIG